MHSFRHLGLVLLITLAACGQAATTISFTLPSTPAGRLCSNQCVEAHDFCRQDCDIHQRSCVGKVQSAALLDYEKYTRDQFANHLPIELRPRDFERTADCDGAKKSCLDACDTPYQSCYASCGGVIETTTSCQYFCF